MEARRHIPATTNGRAARKVAVAPQRLAPGHTAQFYEREEHLYDVVSRFVAEGLERGEGALVLARAERFADIAANLHARGVDVRAAEDAGLFLFVDTAAVLHGVIRGTTFDAQRFRTRVTALLKSGAGKPSAGRVRVYGELVDVLVQQGLTSAALRMEEIWNELSQEYHCSLLCGYSLTHFARAEAGETFAAVCDQHVHVEPAPCASEEADVDGRARELSELQQRAIALAAEVEERKRLEQHLREALEERRRAEEQIRGAQEEAELANAAKSEFLAVVSHELRTPLNAILGYHDLLEHEIAGPLGDRQRVYVERIGHAAHQLLQLINQVLTLTRAENSEQRVQAETVDLGGLVRETAAHVAPLAGEKHLTLAIHDPEAPLIVTTDAGKLRQVLLNLLSNAVKFTAAGGIAVSIRRDESSGYVDVQDTGVGVAAEDQERIFDPFVQVDGSASRRFEGTGLGLSVSRAVARLLGGDVTVRSAPGTGSVFTVRLPWQPAAAPVAGAAAGPAIAVEAVSEHATRRERPAPPPIP